MQHLFKVLFLIAVSVTVVIAATVGVLNVMSSQEGLDFLSFDSPRQPTSDAEGFATRMLALDANNDGLLTRNEVLFEQQLRTFDRADTNRDGVVTKEELLAAAGQELARRDGPPTSPHRPEWRRGGPPSRGRPGQLLSPPLYEALRLTDEQKQQLAALQSEVDARMEQILTAEQQNQLQSMRDGFGRLGREGRPSAPAVHE